MSDVGAVTGDSLGAARRARLAQARLYVCTDARRERGDLLDFAARCFDGGVDILQLRDKNSPGEQRDGALTVRQEIELLQQLRQVAAPYGALVAANDRADIAVAAGVDVLHVGQDDLPVAAARTIVGPDVVVGLSTRVSAQGVAAAQHHDLDYFCVGPVWATPTKPGRAAVGTDLVAETAIRLADSPSVLPWFAIGGIDSGNVSEVVAAGAERIVVVRALTQAANPAQAARALRAAVVR